MNLPFIQSHTWQKFQETQGKKTFRLKNKNFEVLALLDQTPLGPYLSCPYGPVLVDKSALKDALSALKQLAAKQNAIFIRFEPQTYLTPAEIARYGAKKVHDVEPAATWLLDLSQDEDTLLKGIEKEKVRLWRNSAKRGVTFRHSTNPKDVSILVNLLAKIAQKNEFSPHTEKYLTTQVEQHIASLYLAELDPSVKDPTQKSEKIPIAASMVYDDKDTRYYIHAAADYAHRKFSAGSTILIEEILDAKKQGQKFFDFWGITTSTDKNHPWYGFTQFKKSYGGFEKIYSGTYDLPIKKTKYCLYSLLRPINKFLRKLR